MKHAWFSRTQILLTATLIGCASSQSNTGGSLADAPTETNSHAAHAKSGAICLGPDLSKGQRSNMIFMSVDNSAKLKFSGNAGTIVPLQLDLNTSHVVTLYEGASPFESLELNFKKLKSNFAVLWKAPGAWKIAPVRGEKCQPPLRK